MLVVEDDRELRESLVDWLQVRGVEAQGVEHGQAAFRTLHDGYPACAVLLDLDMPVMNGFAGALALRAEAPDLLLVALSAYLDEDNRGRAVAIGFDLCVMKGGEFADFRRELDALVQRHADRRSAAAMQAPVGADAAQSIST